MPLHCQNKIRKKRKEKLNQEKINKRKEKC